MIDEIFADLAPLAEKNNITLEREGDGAMTGSDTLIYRLLFNRRRTPSSITAPRAPCAFP